MKKAKRKPIWTNLRSLVFLINNLPFNSNSKTLSSGNFSRILLVNMKLNKNIRSMVTLSRIIENSQGYDPLGFGVTCYSFPSTRIRILWSPLPDRTIWVKDSWPKVDKCLTCNKKIYRKENHDPDITIPHNVENAWYWGISISIPLVSIDYLHNRMIREFNKFGVAKSKSSVQSYMLFSS